MQPSISSLSVRHIGTENLHTPRKEAHLVAGCFFVQLPFCKGKGVSTCNRLAATVIGITILF